MTMIHVRATNNWLAQEQLTAAEDRLRLQAMQSRTQGILVTRTGMGHFTVALSEHVPYGFTHQLDKER